MRSVLLVLTCAFALAASDELFDAARKGDAAAVKVALDKGAPVDAKWRYDQTALFIAAFRGHSDAVKLLLERGAKPDVKDTFYGMSPLSAAAGKGKTDIVEMLMAKGATVEPRLLQMAASGSDTALLKVLLAKGTWSADALSDALAAAEAQKKPEAAELLKSAGAKPKPAIAVDAAALTSYAGQYKGTDGPFRVEVAEGQLTVAAQGGKLAMRALDQTSFEPVQYPGMMKIVFRTADGKVNGVDLIQGGSTQFLPREDTAK